MNRFDVIIVGSGPSGASSAYELSNLGFRVLILEKEKIPRYKTCGGGITGRALNLLPLQARAAIEVNCQQVEFRISPNLYVGNVRREESIISMSMRANLDSLLVATAVEAGSTVVDEAALDRLTRIKNGYLVHTRNAIYECQYIVAADGVQSTTAALANFKKMTKFWPALEWELYVSEESLKRYDGKAVLDLNFYPGGYAWVFPKKDHISVGLGGPKTKNMNKALDLFLEKEDLNNYLKVEKNGYVIPAEVRPGPLAKDGIFLVGDAAGLVDPLFGEGIYFGLASARLVSESLHEFSSGKVVSAERAYENKLSTDLLPDIRSAKSLCRVLYLNEFILKTLFQNAGQYFIDQVINVVLGKRKYPNISNLFGAICVVARHHLSSLQKTVLISLIKVIVGALIIGLLHSFPLLLAFSFLSLLVYRYLKDASSENWAAHKNILLSGMLLLFSLGFLCEWFGTHLGWWIYRFHEDGFMVPLWVPLAWALAFKIFYRIELAMTESRNNLPFWNRMVCVVGLGIFLPPLGEIIAISFGTWKYSFHPQFLGMPLQAVLLIAFVHWLNFCILNFKELILKFRSSFSPK